MKVAAIRQIVKEAEVCVVYTSQRGRQWIGTWDCMFLAEEGMKLNQHNVAGLLDFDEKEQKKIRFYEQALEECAVYAVPRRDLNEMTQIGLDIKTGDTFTVLEFDGKTYLVNNKWIKGAVGSAEYRRYYLGWTEADAPVIVIDDGMVHAGAVLPESADFVEAVQKTLRRVSFCRAGGWSGRESGEDAGEDGEQIGMEEMGG